MYYALVAGLIIGDISIGGIKKATMIKDIITLLKFIFWLIVHHVTNKDASLPQQRIDNAKTAAATADDARLNAAIDAARQRMQNNAAGGGNK